MKNLRRSMPALSNKCYFNYGGQGPLPNLSLSAIKKSWEKIQELGPFTSNVWPYIASEIHFTRKKLAQICGVQPNRLSLSENVTSGCILPLLGLPISEGDQILISDSEHPGIVASCQELASRKKLEISILPVKKYREGIEKILNIEAGILRDLDEFIKPNTRLVVISHLLWNTGQVMPIPSIAKRLSIHKNKPFLLVDAAQSFGHIPIKEAASVADIYAFTGHKWACGPEGLGGIALSERVLSESNPTLVGWRSLVNEESFNINHQPEFHKDGRRFEVATSCIPLMAGLRTSLTLLEEEGDDQERLSQILRKSDRLWNNLKEISGVNVLLQGSPPAGIVSFTLLKKIMPKEIVKRLGESKIWIRNIEEPPCLRACIHVPSTDEEIKILSSAISEMV